MRNTTPRVVGMIHLPALPGAPLATMPLEEIIAFALKDAEALAAGGCDALMMENFGDTPFFPGRVSAVTACAMTAVACAVRRAAPKLPLGINVLRNDGLTALAVAAASGASMIRVNVLTGARVCDQGVIQGVAHDLMRERKALGATNVAVWADVDVKHSAPLAARPLEDEVKDLLLRGMADAVIVSGSGTGAAVDLSKLAAVKRAAGSKPVYIGSGATAETVKALSAHADGYIVGTALKKHGEVSAPVERGRVEAFVKAAATRS